MVVQEFPKKARPELTFKHPGVNILKSVKDTELVVKLEVSVLWRLWGSFYWRENKREKFTETLQVMGIKFNPLSSSDLHLWHLFWPPKSLGWLWFFPVAITLKMVTEIQTEKSCHWFHSTSSGETGVPATLFWQPGFANFFNLRQQLKKSINKQGHIS